jgi:hypothetical protein
MCAPSTIYQDVECHIFSYRKKVVTNSMPWSRAVEKKNMGKINEIYLLWW